MPGGKAHKAAAGQPPVVQLSHSVEKLQEAAGSARLRPLLDLCIHLWSVRVVCVCRVLGGVGWFRHLMC